MPFRSSGHFLPQCSLAAERLGDTDGQIRPPTIYFPGRYSSFTTFYWIQSHRFSDAHVSPFKYIRSGTFGTGHLWATWSKVLGWRCLGGAEKWGQGRPPGGWRYRHHFRNKTKKCSPPLHLICLGWGELPSHGSGALQPGCAGKAGLGATRGGPR